MREVQKSEINRWEEIKECSMAVVPRAAAFFGLLFGTGWFLWGPSKDPSVPATISSPAQESVKALLPSKNHQSPQSIYLRNGTRVLLNCLTGKNGSQLDITIESGTYTHLGGDRVLLSPNSNSSIQLHPGASFPTEAC